MLKFLGSCQSLLPVAGSEPLYRELCLFTSGVSGRPLIALTETHTGCLEHCSTVSTAAGATLPARAAATLRNAASQTLLVSTPSSVALFGQTDGYLLLMGALSLPPIKLLPQVWL